MFSENLYVKQFGLIIVEEAVRFIEAQLSSTFEKAMFLANEGIFAESNAKSAFLSESL